MKSSLIETIKIKDGIFFNLDLHEKRLNQARIELLKCKEPILLEESLKQLTIPTNDLYKCRLSYAQKIDQIELEPYTIRAIHSFKLIHNNEIQYQYKYKNRSTLKALFQQRGSADDIIIVKNSLLTDSYYANLVFDDGKHLYTPRLPLLKGTKRAQYIQEQRIIEQDISPADLKNFECFYMINAMIDLGEMEFDVNNIYT
ncbi:MAG: aminotransferase class IV [Bacteroidota bacterium]